MPRPVIAHGLTLAAVAMAWVVRWELDPYLGDKLPFAPFYLAVVAATWLGGVRPALLAAGLGFVLGWYCFVPARFSFGVEGTPHVIGLVAYWLAILAILAVHEAKRRREGVGDARVQQVADAVPALLAYVDAQGCYRLNNRAYEEWFGHPRGELVGRHLRELLGDEAWKVVLPHVAKALSGEVVVYEAEVPYRDGGTRWIFATYTPDVGPGGVVRGFVAHITDITRRKRAENALRESEERLRGIFDQTLVGVAETDLTGRFVRVNQRYCEIVGRSATELVCLRMQDITPPDDPIHNLPLFERAVARGVPFIIEKRYLRPDGSVVWVSNSVSLIRDAGGEAEYIVAACLDITDRKRTEETLRDSEAHFRNMADQAPTMLWVTEPSGNATYLSKSWYEYTGRSPEQDLGLGWLENVHPDDRRQTTEVFLAANQRHEPFSIDYRLRRQDGVYRWMVDAARPRFNDQGQYLGYVGTVTDVHERKQAVEAMKASEARYRAIGEAIDFGVWMCDARGQCTYASESFLRLIGLTPQQAYDLGWSSHLHPEDRPQTLAAWDECVRSGGVWDMEHRFLGVDGRYHFVLARGVPVRDDEGRILGWVGINLDIDRLKQAEAALRETDQRKDEFLATLAHELRNPLAPVRYAVQVLQMEGATGPEIQRATEVIDRQIQGMTRLIDDLLDVSRINRNKLDLRKERVELARVVEQAIETSRPLIEEQGHTLTVTLPPEPIFLDADLTRLAQVFWNLLNNAAKYTEKNGHIALRAECRGSEVLVTVSDTGIGIPTDHLPVLFKMFSQVEGALARSQGGLGIGLAVVKRLVEMHGGTIEARSDGPGKGSEFLVRLPVTLGGSGPSSNGDNAQGALPTSQLRILVVDDSRDAAVTLTQLLQMMGNTVRTAHDGEEAVVAASEFRPQVVLLDIGLPRMNGYEAARAIRREPWGQAMRLIAVTGWGQEDDRRRSAEAGFDSHLVKPVDPLVLMEMLAGLEPRS